MDWFDLDPAGQCVLLSAAEVSTLAEVLTEWAPSDASWSDRLVDVQPLGDAIAHLADMGLIEASMTFSWPAVDWLALGSDDLRAIVHDSRYWMTEEGPIAIVELNTTTLGVSVLSTAPAGSLYDFRKR